MTGEMPQELHMLDQQNKGTARLNFQHWCANVRQGFLVRPSVHLSESAVIGDLGTGTGAWLFELAQKLPTTTTLDGLDITLGHFPHKEWLPKNVQGVLMDIYDPLPASLLQNHDFLHVRYSGIYVKKQDPVPVIEQLKKLVKPGGYIQWTENDLWADKIAKASDDMKSSGTERLYNEIMKILGTHFGSKPGWAQRLPQLFEACGLVDVVSQYHTPPPEMWPAFHDNFLIG